MKIPRGGSKSCPTSIRNPHAIKTCDIEGLRIISEKAESQAVALDAATALETLSCLKTVGRPEVIPATRCFEDLARNAVESGLDSPKRFVRSENDVKSTPFGDWNRSYSSRAF